MEVEPALAALERDLGALLATNDAVVTFASPPLRLSRDSVTLLARIPSPLGGDGSARALVEWSLRGSNLTRRIVSWCKEGDAPAPGPAPAVLLEGVRSFRVLVARSAGYFAEPDFGAATGDAFRHEARVSVDGFTLRAPLDFAERLAPGDEVTLEVPGASDDLEPASATLHVREKGPAGLLLDGRAPSAAASTIARAFAAPSAVKVAIFVLEGGRSTAIERTVFLR